MASILDSMPPDYTRDMIYAREKKRRRLEEDIVTKNNAVESASISGPTDDAPELVPLVPFVPAPPKKAGRPLGATNEAKRDRKERENKAKTDAVQALLDMWAKREPGKRSKKNELKRIIEAAKKKFDVEDLSIAESMIWERAARGSVPNPTRTGRVTPMEEIEPLLVTFIICLQRIGQPLSSTEFIQLANSLIEGSPLEEKVLASKRGMKSGAANGEGYYKSFMNRNKDKIDSKCPRKFPADRTKWTTYPNIESMYDMVYPILVEAGVASRAASPQWTDKTGCPVATEGSREMKNRFKCLVSIYINSLIVRYLYQSCLAFSTVPPWLKREAVY
jgi:hypothetical protein